ncbi:MAG: hypothetical protein JXQ26_03045, partial [Tissierellales bacterium]|nr:hypothetical protein [Tissierellales bacterium]
DRKVIITAILFSMLSVVFSMSGDGENVPVVQKKEAVKTSASVNLPAEQTTVNLAQSTAKETVKDEFGIDTGMDKEKLADFKEKYLKLDKKMFPGVQGTMLYDFKVDLNKYDELKKLGVDLKESGSPVESKSYKENAIYSDIILIGTSIEEDQSFGYDMYKIEIQEILKGADIFIEKLGKIPKQIHYIGEKDVAGQTDPVIGVKGMYFFSNTNKLMKDKPYLHKRPESTVLFFDGNNAIYEKGYQKHLDAIWYRNAAEQDKEMSDSKKKAYERWAKASDSIGKIDESFEDVIVNVRKLLEVNDSKNFYKKTFKAEVQK